MKIEQYFYTIEIADTCSFSQAARNLYISQPNLSHAVKQIEEKVGYPLFERTSKGTFPTSEGRALIERFRILKQEYDQVQSLLDSPRTKGQLYLNVASLNVSRTVLAFSEVIKQFMASPINFSFITYSFLDELLPLVESSQIDFAIIGNLTPFLKQVTNKLSNHSIEYFPFAEAPVCAIVGPENPLYRREGPVTIKDLYPYTIIQYGTPSKDANHSVPYVLGLSAHAYGEVHVNNSQLFYTTIQSTSAVGLVSSTPESFALYNPWENIRILPLSDCHITAQYGYIKSRRVPLSDIANGLLKNIMLLF